MEFLYGYLSGTREATLLRPPPRAPWFDPYRERIQVQAILTGGSASTAERYRRFRSAFGPTADRTLGDGDGDGGGGGGDDDGGDSTRQDTFKALDQDWLVTYNHGSGHSVWVDCPPADADAVRAALRTAAAAAGCQI